MADFKRAALFLKPADEIDEALKLKVLHDYTDANNMVVTVTLYSETEFLECKELFDVILTADTIMLPIAGVEIIKVQ